MQQRLVLKKYNEKQHKKTDEAKVLKWTCIISSVFFVSYKSIFYSIDLSDSVMLILSIFRLITRFIISEKTKVPTTARI